MVLKLGINEWPMPGRVVRRATYIQEYHELTQKDGVPFVPNAVWKDIFFSGFILLAIAVCALHFGPFGPSGQPDPTIIQTAPRPDFFFLWLYALLSFLPPSAETPILLIGPAIGIVVLLALPFVAGEGEKSWKRRPIAVLTILLVAVSPRHSHSSGRAHTLEPGDGCVEQPADSGRIPARVGRHWSATVRSCFKPSNVTTVIRWMTKEDSADRHWMRVALRLTEDQLIRQVIQGGGNMPAYGKNLSPAETTALVAFLETLHPANQTAGTQCFSSGGAGCERGFATVDLAMSEFTCTDAVVVVPARESRPLCWLTALVYLRGWISLRSAFPTLIPGWRLAAFMGGSMLVWTAVASPLATARSSVAHDSHDEASSVDDGCCTADLSGEHRCFRWPAAYRSSSSRTGGHSPVVPGRWLRKLSSASGVVLAGGHGCRNRMASSRAFQSGMHSHSVHILEDVSFLMAGLLFWWPVVQSSPSAAKSPRWSMALYLFLATLPCDILSAFFVFCNRLIYPFYLSSTSPVRSASSRRTRNARAPLCGFG